MMGTKACLFTPLPPVTLEELVPADHFYRHLDRVLNLAFVRELLQDCYAAGLGRPSVYLQVFFRLQLVMFCEGIRSERQLLRLAGGWMAPACDATGRRAVVPFDAAASLPARLAAVRLRHAMHAGSHVPGSPP